MDLQQTTPDQAQEARLNDKIRGAIVLIVGSVGLVGLAFGAMVMVTSPDGWVMKAANQAVFTAQQGTLASYDIAADQ